MRTAVRTANVQTIFIVPFGRVRLNSASAAWGKAACILFGIVLLYRHGWIHLFKFQSNCYNQQQWSKTQTYAVSIYISTHQNANQKLTIGNVLAHRAQCTLPSQSISQTFLSRVPKIDFWWPSSPSMPGMTGHCYNHHVMPVVCVWSRAMELNRWVLGPWVPGPVFIVCPLHALFGKSWIVHLDLIPQIDTFTAGIGSHATWTQLWRSSKSYSIMWQLLTGRRHPKSQGLIYKWVMSWCDPEPCVSFTGLLLILVLYTVHYWTN